MNEDEEIYPSTFVDPNQEVLLNTSHVDFVVSFENRTDGPKVYQLKLKKYKINSDQMKQMENKLVLIINHPNNDLRLIPLYVFSYFFFFGIFLLVFILCAKKHPSRAIRVGMLYPCLYKKFCPGYWEKSYEYYYINDKGSKCRFCLPQMFCSTCLCECFDLCDCCIQEKYFCKGGFFGCNWLQYFHAPKCECSVLGILKSFLFWLLFLFFYPILFFYTYVISPFVLMVAVMFMCCKGTPEEVEFEKKLKEDPKTEDLCAETKMALSQMYTQVDNYKQPVNEAKTQDPEIPPPNPYQAAMPPQPTYYPEIPPQNPYQAPTQDNYQSPYE